MTPEDMFQQAANLFDHGQEAEAETILADIPPDHPLFPRAAHNRGLILTRMGLLHKAAKSYRAALAANPSQAETKPALAEVLSSLAGGLRTMGRFGEAETQLAEALALEPDNAKLLSNMALLHQVAGDMDKAAARYREALTLEPHNGEIHYSLATALLTAGQFEEGWKEFEWRLKCGDAPRAFDGPLWDGGSLTGKTILLYPEQGLGDAIQFARFVSVLKQRGAHVILACKPGLVPLFAHLCDVVSWDDPLPPYDCRASLLSMPYLLGSMEAPVPYLKADEGLVEHWRKRLEGPGFKVGISWRGSPANVTDTLRSTPLESLIPLAEVPGVRLISLQKGIGGDETHPIVENLGAELDEGEVGIFMDTAAVLTHLDLIVTVDTALCHLAGAMGRPVWVMLSTAPDWRNMLAREDSLWYPTMRLFRQRRFGDWPDVVNRMKTVLTEETKP